MAAGHLRRATRLVLAVATSWGVAGATGAKPVVFWANDPVGPGDAVVVLGHDLSHSTVKFQLVGAQTAKSQPVQVLQDGDKSLKFVVPSNLPPGVYQYVISNRRGRAEGMLNAPTIYWMQGDMGETGSPGGWLRIMGRNIARSATAKVVLSTPDKAPIVLSPKSWGIWDARFDLPTDLVPGGYTVTLENGDGGEIAARSADQLKISPPSSSAGPVVARQPSGKDDTAALQSALMQAAAGGGGTVLLRGGYYHLSAALVVPSSVHLKGEARSSVTLIWADSASPPLALIQLGSRSSLESLTVVARRHQHVISGGFATEVGGPEGHDIALREVTVRASAFRGRISAEEAATRLKEMLRLSSGGGDTVRLAGRNIIVEDCDFLGSGRSLYLLHPTRARVSHNVLQNGRLGWYSITGADGVIFEDNTVEGADLQATGGGVNTPADAPRSLNVLIKNNRFERILGWDSEAFTTDGPGGYYYGRVSSSHGAVIAVARPDGAQHLERSAGAAMFVTGGTGAGEYGRIATATSSQVVLERPLPVPLDQTSIITVAPFQANYLFIDNRTEDAGGAAQIFGVSVDHVIAGNVSARADGYFDRGIVYKGVQPSWHTQILDNRITEGSLAGPAVIAVWGRQGAPSTTPLNLGTVVRGNVLSNNANIEVRGFSSNNPGVQDAVIERNLIADSDHSVFIDSGVSGLLVRNNGALSEIHPTDQGRSALSGASQGH